MFAEFTGTNGKGVRIDATAILAVEELDSGCRIHVGASTIEVREGLDAVMAAVDLVDEEDDD